LFTNRDKNLVGSIICLRHLFESRIYSQYKICTKLPWLIKIEPLHSSIGMPSAGAMIRQLNKEKLVRRTGVV
ncbi:MAG: hypothetical protein KAX05_00485, partial [Bacteroidales bacterium]|nr:hypothetical protein [Bacteroidales bacterium]